MVQLTIISPKGNFGYKCFPYTGYLGLTPLRVEGCSFLLLFEHSGRILTYLLLKVVCTRLGNDHKLLPAKSITVSVRCYETRLGRVGVLGQSVLVDYTELLWSKPDGQDYADIGELQFPFRITLPTNVNGLSTVNFPDYRTFWRIEAGASYITPNSCLSYRLAVINHVPITGVGSRQTKHYDLSLVRYDLPPSSPSYFIHPTPCQLEAQTTQQRAPVIRYRIDTPPEPIGPLDLVSIPIHLYPIEPAVSIRSASLIVERRIQIIDSNAPPSPPQHTVSLTPPTTPARPSSSPNPTPSYPHNALSNHPHDHDPFLSRQSSRASSPSFSAASTITVNDTLPLIPRRPSSASSTSTERSLKAKTVTTSVAGVDPSGRFSKDAEGVWSKTIVFPWPASRSSRWAIGETIQSDMVSVRFFARIKVSPPTIFIFIFSHTPLRLLSLHPLVQNPLNCRNRNW
jgi:hypothetical protein